MTNEEILKAPNELLTTLDKQRRFLLRIALTPAPCPACKQLVTQIDAAGVTLQDYDVDTTHAKTKYRCTSCRRELEVIVPFMGPVYIWNILETLP